MTVEASGNLIGNKFVDKIVKTPITVLSKTEDEEFEKTIEIVRERKISPETENKLLMN